MNAGTPKLLLMLTPCKISRWQLNCFSAGTLKSGNEGVSSTAIFSGFFGSL